MDDDDVYWEEDVVWVKLTDNEMKRVAYVLKTSIIEDEKRLALLGNPVRSLINHDVKLTKSALRRVQDALDEKQKWMNLLRGTSE